MIDNYMIFNKSSEAGLYWPGYFEVDTTSPGRIWIAGHRQREKLRNDEMKKLRKAKNQNKLLLLPTVTGKTNQVSFYNATNMSTIVMVSKDDSNNKNDMVFINSSSISKDIDHNNKKSGNSRNNRNKMSTKRNSKKKNGKYGRFNMISKLFGNVFDRKDTGDSS